MIQTPFWIDDYPRPEHLGKDPLPAETDVLIVGAGLTGLSAGLRLASGGRTVTIVDAGAVAGGASAMNGGMVSPDVKAGMRAVLAKHGPDIASEIWDASVRSVSIVKELARSHGIDARINSDGMTALGLSDGDLAKFTDTVRWYRENYGVEWEVLDRGRVSEIAKSAAFTAALYEPEGFGIHPARFSFGLASAASRAGALLVANCEALELKAGVNGQVATTTSGPIRAGTVIVATNGYTTRRPVPALQRKVVPIGSYIIVTEPLTESEAGDVFPANSMTYTKRRLLHYMRRTPDDRILIGGRRNLKTGLPLDESAADLKASLLRYFPQLEGKSITHCWGGKLAVPFDLIPHMGQIDGIWYAMGYAGHGVGLSTLMGHDLAGMILGEDETSPFARIPHNGRIYYRGQPWFLGPASLLYRSLDRIGR